MPISRPSLPPAANPSLPPTTCPDRPAGSAPPQVGRPAAGHGRAPGGGGSDISTILARLATGDHAAVLVLVDIHHDRVASTLLAHLRRGGAAAPSPDELSTLVLVTGFAIADAAASSGVGEAPGAGDPEGPWGWIAARIGGLVDTWATPEDGGPSVGGDVAGPRPTRHTDQVIPAARSLPLPSVAWSW